MGSIFVLKVSKNPEITTTTMEIQRDWKSKGDHLFGGVGELSFFLVFLPFLIYT